MSSAQNPVLPYSSSDIRRSSPDENYFKIPRNCDDDIDMKSYIVWWWCGGDGGGMPMATRWTLRTSHLLHSEGNYCVSWEDVEIFNVALLLQLP